MNEANLALAVTRALLAREGTGPAWGIRIIEARAGYALIEMSVRADMLNGHGIVHGGMIFALADTALAYAANSRNALTVTQCASIQFLAPAHGGTCLVAEAQEVAVIGRTGSYRVEVRTSDDAIVAELTGLTRQTGAEAVPIGHASLSSD